MFTGNEYPVLSLARRLVNPFIIFMGLIIAITLHGQTFNGTDLLLVVLAALVASKSFERFDFFDIPDPSNPGGRFHFRNLIESRFLSNLLASVFQKPKCHRIDPSGNSSQFHSLQHQRQTECFPV